MKNKRNSQLIGCTFGEFLVQFNYQVPKTNIKENQPFWLDTLHAYNRITIKVMPLTAATPPFNRNEVAE